MSDKLKNSLRELREWVAFALVMVTPAMIWAVNIKLENQRMLIEQEVSKLYVSKETFLAAQSDQDKRWEMMNQQIMDTLKSINRKAKNE